MTVKDKAMNQAWDQEWEELIAEAMKIGLTIEEVRKFLKENSTGA